MKLVQTVRLTKKMAQNENEAGLSPNYGETIVFCFCWLKIRFFAIETPKWLMAVNHLG